MDISRRDLLALGGMTLASATLAPSTTWAQTPVLGGDRAHQVELQRRGQRGSRGQSLGSFIHARVTRQNYRLTNTVSCSTRTS
jgi:hypothetical protein